jgi:AcrR family transcriptional regulator
MGRRPQPERRAALLAACTDAVLAHGLPGGLAPLVAATGTSARMLIYHFGSRDQLLREVVAEARRRQRELFGDALAARDEPYVQTLGRAWTTVTGPEGAPFLRLFGQLRAGPVDDLWPEFRQAATTDWLGPIERGLRDAGPAAPVLATMVLAVFRGLLMDRDATGDDDRAAAAFTAFLALLDPTGITADPPGPDGPPPAA